MELTLASNAALVYTTAYTDVGKQLHTLPSQISHSTLRQPQMRNENNIPFIFVSQISPYQLNLGNWFCVWRRRKKGMLLSSSYFVSCMRSNNGTAFNGDAFVSAVINPHLMPDWQLVFHSKFTSLEVRVKLPEYQGEHSTNVFMSCKNAGKQPRANTSPSNGQARHWWRMQTYFWKHWQFDPAMSSEHPSF